MDPVGISVFILSFIAVAAQRSDHKCEKPTLENGRLHVWVLSDLSINRVISYRCDKGYVPAKQIGKLYGTTRCTKTGWYPEPKCLEGCGPPPVVLQGETVQDRMKSYEHGSLLTYKCPLYYTLEGNQNITCRNGLWDDPPVCQGPCTLSEEDMKANGIRRGSFFWWRGSILQHGDRVSFRCVQGYEKSEFSLRVECNNGVIPYPKCTKLENCGSPPVVPYGETIQGRMKSFEHGTVMTYQCLQYYTLEGNRNVTCRYGKWDDPPVCREPCVVTSKDVEENKLLWLFNEKLYFPHGYYVAFICSQGGYKLHRVQCHQGIMAYPKCSRQD
ncbi:coagulation factor XIII B chain [Xenopus laevis]|uniref:Sushi domain-containing protein n=2 Tax=Xenopus laevis TaxID=8355 RepID=A0A974C4T0_XENLA|nr:coagulation factor XIII B chain [Xenopus laevis]OCT66548.1 hypothetical protein XELAEV_18042799mg [Xenopus laevis]